MLQALNGALDIIGGYLFEARGRRLPPAALLLWIDTTRDLVAQFIGEGLGFGNGDAAERP